MAAKFKKWWYSIDFRNNKIINAKTETPTEDEHIVPKSYVDSQNSYDTELSITHGIPFTFSWLPDIKNKSFKEIFDNLFFPRILPTYNNPIVETLTVSVLNSNIIREKFSIFEKQEISFIIKPNFNQHDRNLVGNLTLRIVNSLGTTNFQLTNSEFTGNIVFESTMTISIIGTYSPSVAIKTDSYGDEYIPVEFLSQYNLNIDVKEYFFNKLKIEKSFMFSNDIVSEGIPTYVLNDIPTLFSYKNNINVSENTEIIYDILIPAEYLDRNLNFSFPVYFKLYEIINGKKEYLITVNIKYSWLTYYTAGATIDYNGITYVKCQYNFGFFDFQGYIETYFANDENTNTKFNEISLT